MRLIDHFIAGSASSDEGRRGDVFDPNNGGVQAQISAVVERQGQEKPVCVAELVFRFLAA